MKKTFFIFNTKVFILFLVIYLLYYPYKAFVLNEDIGGSPSSVSELFLTMAFLVVSNALFYSAVATFIFWVIRKLRDSKIQKK